MSRQYNMYNVQLSEFWKQRCGKEAVANTPYGDDFDETGSMISDAASQAAMSQISTTSTVSRAKVRPRPRARACWPAVPRPPPPSFSPGEGSIQTMGRRLAGCIDHPLTSHACRPSRYRSRSWRRSSTGRKKRACRPRTSSRPTRAIFTRAAAPSSERSAAPGQRQRLALQLRSAGAACGGFVAPAAPRGPPNLIDSGHPLGRWRHCLFQRCPPRARANRAEPVSRRTEPERWLMRAV